MKQDSGNNFHSADNGHTEPTNRAQKQRTGQYRQNDWDTTSHSETVLVVDGWDIASHQNTKRDIRYTPRLDK